MSRVLGLREFTHLRSDPRILVVDARDLVSPPLPSLDNPFFPWVRIPANGVPTRLIDELSGRHLILVHQDEERALDLDHVFEMAEIQSSALEGGERGWNEAIIEEASAAFGDTLVVTLNRLAVDRRLYVIVRGKSAIAVQPAGSIAAIREEARHHGSTISAVVDVTPPETDAGVRLANAVGAPYYAPGLPQVGDTAVDLNGLTLEPIGRRALRLSGRGFTIGAGDGATYVVGTSGRAVRHDLNG